MDEAPPSQILSRGELLELTDRRQAAAQIRWLQNRGYKYEIGASGHPKVLRAERDRHMLSAPGRQKRELNLKAVA